MELDNLLWRSCYNAHMRIHRPHRGRRDTSDDKYIPQEETPISPTDELLISYYKCQSDEILGLGLSDECKAINHFIDANKSLLEDDSESERETNEPSSRQLRGTRDNYRQINRFRTTCCDSYCTRADSLEIFETCLNNRSFRRFILRKGRSIPQRPRYG